MAKKRINLAIDPGLDKRWTETAKRMGWTKSGMLEDFLLEVLPHLDDLEPKRVVSKSLKAMSERLQDLSNLIDDR